MQDNKESRFNIRLFYLISVFTIFTVFFLFFAGLLIAAKPYLAVKVYPDNQNIWQDCYAITYG